MTPDSMTSDPVTPGERLSAGSMLGGPSIERVTASVYTFPTPEPESDATLTWSATTAVVVTLRAGSESGLGWTYSSPVAADIVRRHLADVVCHSDAFDIAGGWAAMHKAGRNFGTRGLYMQALSALDVAWWDLKAKLLQVPLVSLLGRYRDTVPIYGSGGFTNLTAEQLDQQIEQ
jgi:L-alanine-DL-glutamate epimerase-like enolase superfamily enzyme